MGKKKQKLALLSLHFISFSHLVLSSICPFSSGHTVLVEDGLSVRPSVQTSLSAPTTPSLSFYISRSPLINFAEANSGMKTKKQQLIKLNFKKQTRVGLKVYLVEVFFEEATNFINRFWVKVQFETELQPRVIFLFLRPNSPGPSVSYLCVWIVDIQDAIASCTMQVKNTR